MQVVHPVNDPSLASYHRPELLALLPGLELALDCWHLLDTNGRGSEKAKYLHKEVGEPPAAYKERLHRSTYAPIFRDSIRAYAGLLSRFQLIDPPLSLRASEQNIDLQGSSVQSFWSGADELAIRDGGVFIFVDMPPKGEDENNYLDEMRAGRTPHMSLIERRDVVNWGLQHVRGREILSHVTVRQVRSVPTKSGYGCVTEPVYLVMRPGSIETIRLERKDKGWTQISEGVVPTSLPIVPIRWYGASSPRFAQGDLPMSGLAELSIQHFSLRSDLQELIHRCAMPVPVRKGAPVGANGRRAPLIIGPNTAIDLDDNGSFEFSEPSGKSLERHQAEIVHVEALMDKSSLNFLYGSSVKTATEASLRSSQVSSQVASLVRNKASAFVGAMRLWAAYAGELASLTQESGISLNESLISRPLDPSGVAQIINLVSSKIISRRTGIEELLRGGVLDSDLKVDVELQKVEEDRAAEEPVPAPVPAPVRPVTPVAAVNSSAR